jgi:hypothetical protein
MIAVIFEFMPAEGRMPERAQAPRDSVAVHG